MATVTDPYQVLGVSRDADKEEIKKAYRRLAKQYHPDTHPDDPVAAEKMNEINQAYDMLTDPSWQGGTGSPAGTSPYGNPGGYGSYGYGNGWQRTYGAPAGSGSGENDWNYRQYRNFREMYEDVAGREGADPEQYREFRERMRRQQTRHRAPSLLRLIWRGFWLLLMVDFLLKSCTPATDYNYDPYGFQEPYGYEQPLQEAPGGGGNGAEGYGYGHGGNDSFGQPQPGGAL